MSRPHRTAFNTVFVSFCALLQILNQFLLIGIIAKFYGPSIQTDSLVAASVLPPVLSAIITGSLSYVLVPDLVAKFSNPPDEHAAWHLASYVGVVTFSFCALCALLLFWGADAVCGMLYPDMPTQEHEVTTRLLKVLSMQVVLTSMISWAQAVLHSRHQFQMAALGGVIGTGATLVIAMSIGKRDITVIAWAMNLGSVVSLMIHLFPMAGRLAKPRAETANLSRLLTVLWPLLLGAAFLRLDPLVDTILASQLDAGSQTHVGWARRIIMALLTVGTSSFSLIAFPQLAEKFASGGNPGFAEHFAVSQRRMTLLIVPIAMGVTVFSVWIIRDLLQRGEFTAEDSRIVGWLVSAFMGLFVGASTAELFSRGFYVLGDTRTPTLIGVLCLAGGLMLRFILFKFVGVWGIATGVSIYFLFTSAILAVVLARRVGTRMFDGLLASASQAILASCVACGCCYLVYASNGNTWLAGPVGAVVYGGGLLLVKNTDALQFWNAGKLRLSSWLGS